jgi:hypothetical protein
MADARDSSPELWSVRANRMQLGSPMAGSGGWLTLTATELRYGLGRPSRLLGSRLMGFGIRYFGLFASEPSWTTPVDEIARIDVVDRTPIAPTAPHRFLRATQLPSKVHGQVPEGGRPGGAGALDAADVAAGGTGHPPAGRYADPSALGFRARRR